MVVKNLNGVKMKKYNWKMAIGLLAFTWTIGLVTLGKGDIYDYLFISGMLSIAVLFMVKYI